MANGDLATVEKHELALTEKDVKAYICPTATDKELYMFMNIAKSYGLNPFKREVHFVKYGQNPGQVIVGYETYLKRAEATGKLNGWKAWVEGDKAKIIIHRKDWEHPFEFEIDIKEFDKQQALWKTMRTFMAKKVVTAIGMRLCFPEDLGGMPYTAEEIVVEHTQEEPPKQLSKIEPDYKKMRTEIREMCLDLNAKDPKKAQAYLHTLSTYKSVTQIPDPTVPEIHKQVTADYKQAFLSEQEHETIEENQDAE